MHGIIHIGPSCQTAGVCKVVNKTVQGHSPEREQRFQKCLVRFGLDLIGIDLYIL